MIEARSVLQQVIEDLRAGAPVSVIAARFHGGVAQMTAEVCRRLRSESGIDEVALSGGVWQNAFLLAQTVGLLQQDRFTIYLHRQTPPNDGGLSLGQAMVAITRLKSGHKE